jgi:hypothetical protein
VEEVAVENERILCGDIENPPTVFSLSAPRIAADIVAARAAFPPVKFERCAEPLRQTLLP